MHGTDLDVPRELGIGYAVARIRGHLEALCPVTFSYGQVGCMFIIQSKRYRLLPNKRIQPTSGSSLRSSCAAAELHCWASGRRTSAGRVPGIKLNTVRSPPADACAVALVSEKKPRIQASPADPLAVASVLEERTGSEASPVDLRAGVLAQMQRRLHRAQLQQPRGASAEVDASCASGKLWCKLTPNQSFQPTSHSSLRSSCAAAELHR